MRLPSRPRDELAARLEDDGIDRVAGIWRESGRPLILVVGHVGNNEAVAAGLGEHGYPINVIADDSVVSRAVRAASASSASRGASR